MLTLIDAKEVYLTEVCLEDDWYVQDLHISTHLQCREAIYQSALEFILKNPNSQMQVTQLVDSGDNPYVQILLENWEKKSRLICYNYNLQNYSQSVKESLGRYLNTKEITPRRIAIEHFKEFLGDQDLEEDKTLISQIMVEKQGGKYLHSIQSQSITQLTVHLADLAVRNNASLIFKVNTYPYFELQYPDKLVLGIWLNIEETASSLSISELEGI